MKWWQDNNIQKRLATQDLASDCRERQRKESPQSKVGFQARRLKSLEKDGDWQKLERKDDEFSLGLAA